MRTFVSLIRNRLGTLFVTAIWTGVLCAQVSAGETGILVNGEELPIDTVRALQQIYPVEIAPGRYWYDPVSGAWGLEGGPVSGQMMAGLALGGALRADASRGTAGVFINSRQITQGEKLYLEQLCQTVVASGRYWILANGLGGYEGAPASFNLQQCPGFARRGGGGGSMSRTYCDDGGNCTSTGVLGYISTTR